MNDCARDTIRESAGFTLIELMLVVSIFAVLALAVYSVFNTGLSAWRKAQGAQNLYQDVRLALDKMTCDLENAGLYSEQEEFINFSGTEKEISFYSLVDVYRPATTPAHPELKKITYNLDESAYILQRQEESFAQSVQEASIPEPEGIACQVSGLKFSYCYEDPDAQPPYSWKNSWDFDGSGRVIPQGVKIELELTEEEKATFTKYVFIPTGRKGRTD